MLFLVLSIFGSFPILLLAGGGYFFYRNHQALSWPAIPIVIMGSEAKSSYLEDSETLERKYSVFVTISFTGHFEGRPVQGTFIRSADVGDKEPSEKMIEEKRKEILNGCGDGLLAHVNPENLTDTMVEPSLAGPIFMIFLGVCFLGLFVFMLFRFFSPAKPAPF